MLPAPSSRALFAVAMLLPLAGCDAIKSALPWRAYYTASNSMEPSLPLGTRLIAVKVEPKDLRRGDVVLVRPGEDTYITRVAALPGDSIAMVNGNVVLNGKPLERLPAGMWTYEDAELQQKHEAPMYAERFPGELKPHRVLDDIAGSAGDNVAKVKLAAGQYFLLGDNRDHAADSRFSEQDFGLGIVKAERIERRLKTG
jgi:signal peptidase I